MSLQKCNRKLNHINKFHLISKCIEVYEESHTSVKLLNCNQILGHVAEKNYIAFIDSFLKFVVFKVDFVWFVCGKNMCDGKILSVNK